MRPFVFWLLALLMCALPYSAFGKAGNPVHVPISCKASVAGDFDEAMFLLYNFWYEPARATFDRIIAADPSCAIAYWGAAMTLNHPLWQPPLPSDVRSARSYLARARGASTHSPREAGLLAAANVLFGDGNPATKRERDERYARDMARMHERFTDDDTTLAYALSLEALYRYGVRNEDIERAGALVEGVLAKQPAHPGALHYAIHAYDRPGYEQRALAEARAYAAAAPAVPHALHMPSHTFVALGMWPEANATNERAYQADEADRKHAGRPSYQRDFHLVWFLVYGNAQIGRYAVARDWAKLASDQFQVSQKDAATLPTAVATERYDLVSMLLPVLTYTIETGDCSLLPKGVSAPLSPGSHAALLEADAACAAVHGEWPAFLVDQQSLEKLRAGLAPATLPIQRGYVEIASLEVAAMSEEAQGKPDLELEHLRAAAEIEQKNTGLLFQPASTMLAQEFYARVLLGQRRSAQAATVLTALLALTPNRTRSLALLAEAEKANADTAGATATERAFSSTWQGAKEGPYIWAIPPRPYL